MMNPMPLAFALAIIASACGCVDPVEADYEDLGLVEVSGTVRLDGQPLAGAVVKFESTDGTFCYDRTDQSGGYTLKLNSERTGVIPGEKLVRISTSASTGEEAGAGDEEDPDAVSPGRTERVPECYHKESKLRVTVTESDRSLDFDLLSDCSVTGPG